MLKLTPSIFSPIPDLAHGVFHPSNTENCCELFSPTNLRKTIEKEGKNLGFETIIIPSLTHSSHVEIIDDLPPFLQGYDDQFLFFGTQLVHEFFSK